MTEKDKKAVTEILKEFDFGKVHETMKALGWGWIFANTNEGIPTIGQLYQKAEELLIDIIEHNRNAMKEHPENFRDYTLRKVATGGLEVEHFIYEDGSENLELRFVVTAWDVDFNAGD